MKGYLDDPEQTAEAIDADGWLHTGDIGVMDERGYVQITDRKKDMFIVGGFNAYPAEIENLMLATRRSPRSRSSASPTSAWARSAWRSWCRVPARRSTEAELIAWSREHMANYKVPRRVEIVDALPLNATGKVDKNALRALT